MIRKSLHRRASIVPICSFSKSFYQTVSNRRNFSSSDESLNNGQKEVLGLAGTSSPSNRPVYTVARLTRGGTVEIKSLTMSDILRDSSMHARDLISLALTSNQDRVHANSTGKMIKKTRPPAAILPRDKDIVMSFGNIRTMIGQNEAILFDAHKPNIQSLADELGNKFKTSQQLDFSHDYGSSEDGGGTFELTFLEEILKEVCDTFNRRLRIYQPIVDSVTNRVSNELLTDAGLDVLLPVKDSLREFEMHVKSCLECLKALLDNEEDMLGLLLAEQRKVKDRGEEIKFERHESVELLVEEYARQLNNILYETSYLLTKIQSKQEMIAISLDANRNRMIRMNIYLSIVTMGCATSTTVAGYYGMNLINGMEESPSAFVNVVMLTSVLGVVIGTSCVSYISGGGMKRRTLKRLEDIQNITGALSDMNAVDYLLKQLIQKRDLHLNREDFKASMQSYQGTNILTQAEYDLLFDILDTSKDGKLYIGDFRADTSSFTELDPKFRKSS